MAKLLTPDEAIARAQALQGDRMQAIKTMAQARQNVTDVREETARQLAELQAQINQRVTDALREDVRAYNAALSAGWTPEELRKIGFVEPEKKRTARRRTARRAPSTGGQPSEPAAPDDAVTEAPAQGNGEDTTAA